MRVGTRAIGQHCGSKPEDHPHACGDKALCCWALDAYSGSSPCVWGQAIKVSKHNYPERIIPMRVGTSQPCTRTQAVRWDHPHACGDKTTIPI